MLQRNYASLIYTENRENIEISLSRSIWIVCVKAKDEHLPLNFVDNWWALIATSSAITPRGANCKVKQKESD